MFPLLWEASGVSYPDLIDRLITLTLQRHEALNQLSYEIQTDAPSVELPRVALRGPRAVTFDDLKL
jgi:hypothetical protein